MLIGSSNAEKIWNYLIGKGLTQYGAAGLMGNLRAESALNPQNLQNSYESKLGYNDSTYTQAVDNGSYNNFVKDSAGYGLAQWTYWSRKQNLLNYANSKGKSIGDLEMQLDFLYKELSEGYKSVLNVLTSATTVLSASNAVLLQFEKPANQSSSVQTTRAKYGQEYFDTYAKVTNTSQSTSEKSSILQPAQSKSSSYNKSYTTTADLNLRYGPDSSKFESMTVIPKGTQCRCYGYYTKSSSGIIWLYIAVTVKGKKYIGFCSKNYLK